MNIETILIAAITLLVGIGIGFLIGRSSMAEAAEHSAEIESELQKIKQDTDDYRNQVNHHFEKTAELVGELTNSYKDMTQRYKKVYEHLAQGAQTLASVDTSKMIVASTIDQLIYEANEDTHVAEKSGGIAAKTVAEQPKQKNPDTDTTTKPASGDTAKKNSEQKQEQNRNQKAREKTPAARTGTGQPQEKTAPIDSSVSRKEKKISPEKKESRRK